MTMRPDEVLRLAELAASLKPATAKHIPPRNEHGFSAWTVAGWTTHEWTRSTTIGDEIEGGFLRLDGPTKRDAERLADVINAFPALVAEVQRLRGLAFAAGLMEQRPCFACGYNGEGYFQPDKHPCASLHAVKEGSEPSHLWRPYRWDGKAIDFCERCLVVRREDDCNSPCKAEIQ